MSDSLEQKKVGDQFTLTVPAKQSEFREHIDRGLRRNGFITNRERSARSAPRKGCQKISHRTRTNVGLQGGRNELHDYMPPDAPEGALDYLTAKWGVQQEALRATKVELRGDWEPDLDPIWHAPNRAPLPPVDRRGEWKPLNEAQARPLRGAMYGLRDGIRPISQPRCQACGRAIVSENGAVGVTATADGRVKLSGLAHCGSVWECPACQMTILQARAAQLRAAVERHGSDRVAMLTLTIRHGRGDGLGRLRRDLSRAFSAMTRSRKWRGGKRKRGHVEWFEPGWKQKAGVFGRVRALEVTHGPNGWHPHIHILFFFDEPVPTATVETKDGRRRVWDCPEIDTLITLWQQQVRRILGDEHVPDRKHAIAATLASDGEYISKLGLELSDPANKKAADGHRTPFQIAADFARAYNQVRDLKDDGTPEFDAMVAGRLRRLRTGRDAKLWHTYCRDMRGAHRLVWSNGLKDALDVIDVTDEDLLADDEERGTGDTWIASIPGYAWKRIRDRRIDGRPAVLHLIEIAERGGSEAFDAALLRVAAGEQ